MEKLRQQLLAKNVNSLKQLTRKFSQMDKDLSGSLDTYEFAAGVRDIGVDMPLNDIVDLFKTLDKDGSGKLSIDELMEALTPPLNAARKDIIKQAFAQLDKTGDQKVTVADLKGVYDVKSEADFISGKKTEEQLMTEFLNNFEPDEASRDGEVTLAEFEKYYAGVSNNIDSDDFFIMIIKARYKL
ncbi:calcyphosin-like [Patiria miniata]|uniref:EF-hand domain-containing protein n=1 Tax=Patiria miniata TaxID=46514 RepID=A0A913Z9W3_PATMI|nr:calcyphosin-like [Patiria miniata]XP_038048552.1 calcyphosin-like [Patiria miniata]